LLHTNDYTKFLKMYPKEENMKPKVVDRVYPYIAMESWLTIFYQVLRIYYLNRITPKNFKALPGIPPNEAIVDPLMTKSNIYSVAETILLKWMSFHANQLNPTQAHQLTNFAEDLADSTVFAYLIRSHYGETNSLKSFRYSHSNNEQLFNNAKMIIKAVEEIGI
jgi:Calponin homology (CH) domain